MALKTKGMIDCRFGIRIAALNTEQQSDSRNADMRKTINVLSLGREEWRTAVREALPPRLRNDFWGVNSSWDLCTLPQSVLVDIAVLHHSFALHDLRRAAEYIRRRWPDAVILVVGEQAEQLDDPLYDDKTNSEISPEELASILVTSVEAKRMIRRKVRIGMGSAR